MCDPFMVCEGDGEGGVAALERYVVFCNDAGAFSGW